MIRRIGILVMAVLLCSCSAEQRLARLLKQHPELRTGTKTVLVPVNIPIPHESASIDIDVSELLECEPDSAAENRKSETDTVQLPAFSVTAGNAKATLRKKSDGKLELTAEQLPDTIQGEAPAEVPEITVHDLPAEESSINTFFRILGYIVGGILLIMFILFILKKFFFR